MKSVTGIVTSISILPARTAVVVHFYSPGVPDESCYLQEGGTVTMDGARVRDAAHLAELLIAAPNSVEVTLHPRTDRYGAATDAEFVTQKA